MKKCLVTILAFVYLSVSSGATINMHYCMGKLMNWDLTNKQNTKCGSCGMSKSIRKGCCKDEHKVLKIEKDQKASESAFQFLNIVSDAVAITYGGLLPLKFSSIVIANPVAHAPPQPGSVPIFILNCNFRI